MLWTNLPALVQFAKRRADRWLYDGRVGPTTQRMMALCSHEFAVSPEVHAAIIYTRDVGHHESGWWKNPEYERCLHLSISYRTDGAWNGVPVPHDKKQSALFAEAFFDESRRLCWIEGPYSPEGRVRDVWHYRVFCDPSWTPILPRGEVYSRDLTEAGWKSFSDIHGALPAREDAPYLLEGQ